MHRAHSKAMQGLVNSFWPCPNTSGIHDIPEIVLPSLDVYRLLLLLLFGPTRLHFVYFLLGFLAAAQLEFLAISINDQQLHFSRP
jgi:hypothetical protein